MKYQDTEFNNEVKKFHKESPRHVLSFELSVDEENTRKLFKLSENGRRYKNRLVNIVNGILKCYNRDSRVQSVKKQYEEASKNNDDARKKLLGKRFSDLQKEYGLTKYVIEHIGTEIYRDFNIPSVYRCTLAEDVYRGVEAILYREGAKLHYTKRGDLPSIRGKTIDRFIQLKLVNSNLCVKMDDMLLYMKSSELDFFEREEVKFITQYLKNSEEIDRYAVEQYNNGVIVDTFRPCYVTLILEERRGRKRVYAKVMIEGNPLPKKNKDGSLKHVLGKGIVGVDVGTQSLAYTSENDVGMFNLADERWNAIEKQTKKDKNIKRKMARSRFKSNPENYTVDGTVKKGSKIWKESKHYRKLRRESRDLQRSISESRKYAINEEVNRIREMGDEVHIEQKNAKELQRRIKVVTSDGKIEHHRNHGRAIQNRSSGYFQSQLKDVFERTGGKYIEVNKKSYRASQFNHITGIYTKKALNVRMYELSEGITVQRDMYSSLLLHCMKTQSEINAEFVKDKFPKWLISQNEFISRVKREKIKILNSGIRV